jgi:hypothetical protein
VKAGVRGSQFGGYTELIRDVRTTFENLLRITLENGDLNSDEAVYSLMPYKYPYLIPTTIGIDLQDLHHHIRILEDQNRKPVHPRSFRPSFESEESIADTQDKMLINYHITQSLFSPHLLDIEAIFLDENSKLVNQGKVDPAADKAKRPIQVHSSFLINGIVNLIQDKSALCRRTVIK